MNPTFRGKVFQSFKQFAAYGRRGLPNQPRNQSINQASYSFMDTSYSSDSQRHQSEVAVKHEPMEDSMSGSAEFPMDMSVAPRDNRREPPPPQGYMPVSMDNRAYFSALYANMNCSYPFQPQDQLNQQRYHGQGPPHPPMPQHPIVTSPPSQRPQLPPQPKQQPKQQRSPPQEARTPRVRRSPTEKQLSPEESYPGFKIKDNKGKLAIVDIFPEGDGDLSAMDDYLPLNSHQRAKREFVPDNKKDQGYWCKRLKNNDSARRSRVKRKALEKIMETRLMELQKENIELRHEMAALKRRYDPDSIVPGHVSFPQPSGAASTSSSNDYPEYSPSISRDEDLELENSEGSDDSHSHDDSRSYNISSMSALSHSLGPARDRADSFGSGTSSGGQSSRPESRSSQPGNVDFSARTDRSGALDLTSASDSNRSTPAQESISQAPESCYIPKSSRDGSPPSNANDADIDKALGQNMKRFPLKCRYKRERQSAAQTSPPPSSHVE